MNRNSHTTTSSNDIFDHTTANGTGTNRPRRPSPDTIAYLRSLPLDYDTARSEIQRYQDYLQLQQSNKNDTNGDETTTTTTTTTATNHPNDTRVEFPTSLAVAIPALYEIQHEMASLAGDEHGSAIIELLCHITIPISKSICRMILQGIGGGNYAVHLATHRYGSHVLQTILQLSSQYCYSHCDSDTNRNHWDDLALHPDAPLLPSNNNNSNSSNSSMDTTTSIIDHIIQIAAALHPVATELMVHICGSHCLRTIFCILGNVTLTTATVAAAGTTHLPLLQQRRGKIKSSKKKKKKIDANREQHDTSRNPLNEPRMMYPSSHWSPPTTEMIDLLQKFTSSLTDVAVSHETANTTTNMVGPGQLQSWVCHASAGPVITVLLQVWAYYEYAKEQDGKWETLRQQQLQWEVQQTTPDRHIGIQRPEPRYPVGSMTEAMARRILCWRNDMEQQTYGSDVLYGYAGEPRGSHCLETLLRLSPDSIYEQILTGCNILNDATTMKEYIHDTVSNFVLQTILQTIRTLDQAMSILQAIAPNMAYLLDPIHKRRWIVWRMVELAAIYTDCQGMVIHMMTDGFTTLQQQQQQAQMNNNGVATTTSINAADTVKMKLNKCIHKLLNIVPPKEYGERVGVDIAGTRIVFHLLQYQTEFCSDTIKGILELSSNDMELLIKDPFVSRCIFDEIINDNGRAQHHPMYINARKRLVTKLQNRWVNIAIDRVGYHMIQQLFFSLDDIPDKKLIVNELITGKNRMNSNSMGRNVLDALHVRIYEMNGETEWINTMKRQASKQEWLKEIIDTKTEKTNPHLHQMNNSSAKMAVMDDECDRATTGTKRSTTINIVASNVKNSKKKQRVSKSVDTIMDAISIPTQQ